MKRILLVLALAAVIAAMIALSAGPALAVSGHSKCTGIFQSAAHAPQPPPPFVDIVCIA